MRYVCLVNSYHNCRVHDGITSERLMFFNSIREIINYMVKDLRNEIAEIYSTHTGKKICTPHYELSGHSCTGILLKIKSLNIRTSDDGHGKLTWKSN